MKSKQITGSIITVIGLGFIAYHIICYIEQPYQITNIPIALIGYLIPVVLIVIGIMTFSSGRKAQNKQNASQQPVANDRYDAKASQPDP